MGGPVEGQRLDRNGHREIMPVAAAANLAGLKSAFSKPAQNIMVSNKSCRAATQRLQHTSDHYGRLPRRGHEGHLKEAAMLATDAGHRTIAQHDRYHTHFSQEPMVSYLKPMNKRGG